MLGDTVTGTPDWGIVTPPDTTGTGTPAAAGDGSLFSQIPGLFTDFEKARLANAATNAQIAQINQYGNINPAWIIAGIFVVLIAFARR